MDTPQFAALYGVWASASAAAGKADVIHIHNFSQFLPVFRRAHPRARLVLHMHCDWLGCLDPEALRPNLEHADAIWTCSNHILLRARDRFPEFKTRFSYVPNGVEVDRFKLARRRLPQGPVDAPILFVGRLSPEKGLHVLIEAFARVTARRPDARLWLVGPDAATPREFLVDIDSDPQVRDLKRFDPNDYSRVLKEMIPEALRTRVRFLGQHPPATLPALYAKAGVLVNPSLSESFGMSLIEAMAAGVPVVATHTGGMPEIIESGCTGLLVPPGDPKALAEAIEQALSDIPLRVRLIRNAAQLATARFSWDRIADDVRIRYTKLLQTPAVTT